MVNQLISESADCIQGSTYIRREGLNFMGMLIDADFFYTIFLILPALSAVASTGLFCGSNAVWRTSFLHTQPFHTTVQTEDIEFSIRALFRNAKINFSPQSRSGELAPASFGSFYKQRLRWCMGWDQVTLMHTKAISGMQELSFALRFGMHWMLIGRWVSLFFMLVNAAMAPLLLIDKGFFPRSLAEHFADDRQCG
ncbi:unnamed protein product [Polarella glacialis]|uniref:Glycosyltransferase 2-like domain-containing protein n=1 Tax=Polarella glacialis TaxID=89957 RepID=A0A813LVN1_POLGL|nr:unnamed protein product [Polarella glacialis]